MTDAPHHTRPRAPSQLPARGSHPPGADPPPGEAPSSARRRLVLALGAAGVGALAVPGPLARAALAAAGRSARPGARRPAFRGPVPAAVMRRVYEEVQTPFKYGVVVPTPPGAGNVDAPSVFRHGDRWYMLYASFRGDGYETLLAESPDLLRWTPLGAVLPFRPGAWDATQAAGYAALQDTRWGGSGTLGTHRSRYWMTYLGGDARGYEAGRLGIGVAHTAAPHRPAPWTRVDRPVLTPADPDARPWERSKLFKSTVIHDPGRTLGAPFVMYYNATPDPAFDNEVIGIALSDDMVRWRRHGREPAVRPYAEGAPGSLAVCGDPQVVRLADPDGDVWAMFFWNAVERAPNGFGAPNGVFDAFACSYDLVHWTRWDGPMLMSATRPYDAREAHKPWLVKHAGVVYHFYSAVGLDGRWSIALATSRDLHAPEGSSGPGGGLAPGVVRVSASHTFHANRPEAAADAVVAPTAGPAGPGAAERRWTAVDSPNRADWLQVDFDEPRRLSGLRLHLVDDGDRVRPPSRVAVEVRQGGAWVPARDQAATPAAPAPGANAVAFAPVVAAGVRVTLTHRRGGYLTRGPGEYAGVTEIEFLA